jgi:hypothetical protein
MSNTAMDFGAVIGLAPVSMPPPPPPQNSLATLEMDVARSLLEPFRSRALALCAQARQIAVADHDGQVAATELAAGIKKDLKKIEDARKSYTGPVNDHIKAVNGLAKDVSGPLEAGLSHLVNQLNRYAAQVELERRKAEEAARRQAEEEQKRLNAEAKAAGVQAPLVPEVLPPQPETAAVRTEAGTSFQRKTWTRCRVNTWS